MFLLYPTLGPAGFRQLGHEDGSPAPRPLRHSGTDAARQIVLQRYPALQPFLTHKKHQHRAEAYLIGAYGARKMRREEENLDIPA